MSEENESIPSHLCEHDGAINHNYVVAEAVASIAIALLRADVSAEEADSLANSLEFLSRHARQH